MAKAPDQRLRLGRTLEIVLAVGGDDLVKQPQMVGYRLGDAEICSGREHEKAAGCLLLAQICQKFLIVGQEARIEGGGAGDVLLGGGASVKDQSSQAVHGSPAWAKRKQRFQQGVRTDQSTVEVDAKWKSLRSGTRCRSFGDRQSRRHGGRFPSITMLSV